MAQIRIPSAVAGFFANQRGNGLSELAITLPVLIALFAGGTDIASGFSTKLKTQQAATRAIELATAGGLNSDAFYSLRSEAATAAGVPTSQVTTDYWLECDGVRQTSISDTCVSGAQAARFASVTIQNYYSPYFSFLLHTRNMTQDGRIPVTGFAEVRVQ